ncbi:Txe/YoeB family addiction module toxin [Anaerotalea alkaliphila]|uniref:Endoribonuclease YoeB n=1 Tax=Anaerotalea alkaliphila TaxID=2662126 RepID=A0A7X5HTL1_9FIRM|nr:Txe/YoeB family addiction module toxin [Anaerotalea alkaliphila]NDL66411.1 Txe/YoeB family addiction module toxin [Anaerotalea alkaliphila]
MIKVFSDAGWEDYLFWQQEDWKMLKKINTLIKDIERNGNIGIGKPEALKGDLSGYWSRRINDKDRLIYRMTEEQVIILACRTHYGEH